MIDWQDLVIATLIIIGVYGWLIGAVLQWW